MHAGTLLQSAQTALAILGNSGILKNAYLAGESALALHLGHRRSYDFDFFSGNSIRAELVEKQLSEIGQFTDAQLIPPHTILGKFNGVKFSLFQYPYPMIKPYTRFGNISLASVADIAAMKLSSVSGRATKRDYVDLYIISQRYSLEQILLWYEQKFGLLSNNKYVIFRALGFFEDAESDEMPEMLVPAEWKEVKEFLISESLRLGKNYLEEE